MLARAAAEIIDGSDLASMVCFLTTCWKDGIIVAVNAPFHKAFGWSTEDLSFCATPGICLSPETDQAALAQLDSAIMLGIPATVRLFCTTRIGRALLCDLTARACMPEVAIGTQMRTLLCTCRLYELPTLDSFYQKSHDPWLSPPPVAFLDRECLARANQARAQLRLFCSTPGDVLDPSCVCLVAAATPPFTVQYVSAGWTKVMGHCLEEVLDAPCLSLLHGPGTCRSTLDSLDAALHENRVVTVQLVLYTHAAPRLPLSATVQLVRIRTAAGGPEHEGATAAPRPEAMGLICSNVTRIASELEPILIQSLQRSPIERGGARSQRAKGASSQEMPPPPPRPPKRSREVVDAEQQPP